MTTPESQAGHGSRDSTAFVDLLIALGYEKKRFFLMSVLGVALGLAVALTVPRYYTATTVILPPQQQQAGQAGALAQLGALAGVAGAATGMKTPEDLYLALLKSRSLQTLVVQKLKLQERYGIASMDACLSTLSGRVKITVQKSTGLITINADDRNPQFAAELADAYVAQLRDMMSRLALTEAQQRRLFFEKQQDKIKNALVQAEIRFAGLQQTTGLMVTASQAEMALREAAETRRLIAELEVKRAALGSAFTAENASLRALNAQLSTLRQRLSQLEGGGHHEPQDKANPDRYRSVQAYRDAKTYEVAYEQVTKQLELARLDEAKEGPLLQQVDPAIPPEFPSKPKRILVLLGIAMAFSALGALWSIVRGMRRVRAQSANGPANEPTRLQLAWRLRGS